MDKSEEHKAKQLKSLPQDYIRTMLGN